MARPVGDIRPPGVYVSHIEATSKAITLADTRVAGFVGLTAKGPLDVPMRISSWDEFVATFGLLAVIWGVSRRRATVVPFAVGAYITSAYWFTASTSFANPAVTVARALTNTFAGIRPADVPGFIAGQVAGAVNKGFVKWNP